VRAELSDRLTPSVRDELSDRLRPSVLNQLHDELTPSVLKHLHDELTPSVRAELSDALTPSVRDELSDALTPSVRAELSDALTPSIRAELSDALTPSVRDELRDTLKPSISDELTPSVLKQLRADREPEVLRQLRAELEPTVRANAMTRAGLQNKVAKYKRLTENALRGMKTALTARLDFAAELVTYILEGDQEFIDAHRKFSPPLELERLAHRLFSNKPTFLEKASPAETRWLTELVAHLGPPDKLQYVAMCMSAVALRQYLGVSQDADEYFLSVQLR